MAHVMSTGAAARELSVSASLIRKLEGLGLAPPAQRIVGLDRRLYSAQEIEELRKIIANRRARTTQPPPTGGLS